MADIAELNKVLERAVNLKNFLKAPQRIRAVAGHVAQHYRENVEPLGYKAFLVGVDREACALYKHALDEFLPSEYSEVVYTANHNDSALLKQFHRDDKQERAIRKAYGKVDKQPKILIVTEKLLTGFDAPVLYAMYLDKPMRDHTLLQAISRVNRPYENEAQGMVKPHGFVLDFVGIFDKLEKALAFDSDEIDAVVRDLKLLKAVFKTRMEEWVPGFLALVQHDFNDRDIDHLIAHFRDKERRKEFFKGYKALEILYEIISPDAFLRPFLDGYASLSAIYDVVRKAYTHTVYVDREFQSKTNALVQSKISTGYIKPVTEFLAINAETIEYLVNKNSGDDTKVINLIRKIEQQAEDESDDPFLIAMAERARAVQEQYEGRQLSTEASLAEILAEIKQEAVRKQEQAAKGFDGLTFFVYRTLLDAGIDNAEAASSRIKQAFTQHPHWQHSEAALRELRQQVTFAIVAEVDDLDAVTSIVDELFRLLGKAYKRA